MSGLSIFASEHRRKFKERLQMRDSTGGQTVSSVLAVLRFIESGRPDCVVLENVRMGENSENSEDGIQRNNAGANAGASILSAWQARGGNVDGSILL
jgi:hypothetical protein